MSHIEWRWRYGNGVRETSRTGLPWMIQAMSKRTHWIGNGNWSSLKCGACLDTNVSHQLQQQHIQNIWSIRLDSVMVLLKDSAIFFRILLAHCGYKPTKMHNDYTQYTEMCAGKKRAKIRKFFDWFCALPSLRNRSVEKYQLQGKFVKMTEVCIAHHITFSFSYFCLKGVSTRIYSRL